MDNVSNVSVASHKIAQTTPKFGMAAQKKINRENLTSFKLRDVVVGDGLIYVANAIKLLGLPFDEVATIVQGMGGPMEVPFAHFTTAEGVEIGVGTYRIEGLGLVTTEASTSDSSKVIPELTLQVQFEKHDEEGAVGEHWATLMGLIKGQIKERKSIFRGRALKVVEPQDLIVPSYIDTSLPSNLALNASTQRDLNISLFTPITRAADLKAIGVKAQRGILVHGKYGTGKSLIAYEAAKRAVNANRSFVLCTIPMLSIAVQVSRFLQPSVLFIEDMDEMGSNSIAMSTVRNMLSGVENKQGFDTITVMTTNFIEKVKKLDRSLLRPERIDAIIEIPTPDPSTVGTIVTKELGDWMENDPDGWKEAFLFMSRANATPAILVETCNRAKIAAIEDKKITLNLFDTMFGQMVEQIRLSEPEPPMAQSVGEQLAKNLGEIVEMAVS